MILYLAALALHIIGAGSTFKHLVEQGEEQEALGRVPTEGWCAWAGLMTVFWPVYWAGKLALVPVDRLLLPPPGDGV